MREIQFRGFSVEHNMWFYGYLEIITNAMGPNRAIIHQFSDWNLNSSFEVDVETIGEYTGLKDSKGKMIYEGDIVKYDFPPCGEQTGVFIFQEGVFFLEGSGKWRPYDCEVIGNIHKNKELITH